MRLVKEFRSFLIGVIADRKIILSLAKNDLKQKFSSSFLGVVWTFIQPIITILVFAFVFQVGFKAPPVNDTPFILWFIPAFLIWSFFSQTLIDSSSSLKEYSYLVKKVNFRVSIIPIMKIISASFIHIGFIIFILIIYSCYGIFPSINNIQVLYYFLCTVILLVGLCWLFSAISALIPDTIGVLNIFIQIGFWLTPIMWNYEIMSPTIVMFMKLNPMFYICRGYRDCFTNDIWFWQRGFTNIYFWVVTLLIFIIGAFIFKKLRPHFADVL